MTKPRYTDSYIMQILKEAETRAFVAFLGSHSLAVIFLKELRKIF